MDKFDKSITGKKSYNEREKFSKIKNDPIISCRESTKAIRQPMPKFLEKSVYNIDKYLPTQNEKGIFN